MKVIYTGVPILQVLYSENIDMLDSTILGIEKVTADCSDRYCLRSSLMAEQAGGAVSMLCGQSCPRKNLECRKLLLKPSVWILGRRKQLSDS